jgi:hypothetical protein
MMLHPSPVAAPACRDQQLTVVTTNERHFKHFGVAFIFPP